MTYSYFLSFSLFEWLNLVVFMKSGVYEKNELAFYLEIYLKAT